MKTNFTQTLLALAVTFITTAQVHAAAPASDVIRLSGSGMYAASGVGVDTINENDIASLLLPAMMDYVPGDQPVVNLDLMVNLKQPLMTLTFASPAEAKENISRVLTCDLFTITNEAVSVFTKNWDPREKPSFTTKVIRANCVAKGEPGVGYQVLVHSNPQTFYVIVRSSSGEKTKVEIINEYQPLKKK